MSLLAKLGPRACWTLAYSAIDHSRALYLVAVALVVSYKVRKFYKLDSTSSTAKRACKLAN
jgi:hypothetical protein